MGKDSRSEEKDSVNPSNVLIIDDEPGNLNAYQNLLQVNGFDTKTIATQSEALAIMADQDFDAVIIDLRSPSPTIIDLAERIKRSFPLCCVFLLTDELAPAFIKKALNVGVESCLFKPFLPTILLESVKKGVERICLLRDKEKLEKELLFLREVYSSFKECSEQIRDPLTGTLKQDYLIDRLESEVKRAKRHEHWLSLCLFQPKFKEKDSKNLVYLAKFLEKNIRSCDVLGRYEKGFAIITPETNEEGAWALGERLKQDMIKPSVISEDKKIELSQLEGMIDFASSTYPTDSHLSKKLIRIAESRL